MTEAIAKLSRDMELMKCMVTGTRDTTNEGLSAYGTATLLAAYNLWLSFRAGWRPVVATTASMSVSSSLGKYFVATWCFLVYCLLYPDVHYLPMVSDLTFAQRICSFGSLTSYASAYHLVSLVL